MFKSRSLLYTKCTSVRAFGLLCCTRFWTWFCAYDPIRLLYARITSQTSAFIEVTARQLPNVVLPAQRCTLHSCATHQARPHGHTLARLSKRGKLFFLLFAIAASFLVCIVFNTMAPIALNSASAQRCVPGRHSSSSVCAPAAVAAHTHALAPRPRRAAVATRAGLEDAINAATKFLQVISTCFRYAFMSLSLCFAFYVVMSSARLQCCVEALAFTVPRVPSTPLIFLQAMAGVCIAQNVTEKCLICSIVES